MMIVFSKSPWACSISTRVSILVAILSPHADATFVYIVASRGSEYREFGWRDRFSALNLLLKLLKSTAEDSQPPFTSATMSASMLVFPEIEIASARMVQ